MDLTSDEQKLIEFFALMIKHVQNNQLYQEIQDLMQCIQMTEHITKNEMFTKLETRMLYIHDAIKRHFTVIKLAKEFPQWFYSKIKKNMLKTRNITLRIYRIDHSNYCLSDNIYTILINPNCLNKIFCNASTFSNKYHITMGSIFLLKNFHFQIKFIINVVKNQNICLKPCAGQFWNFYSLKLLCWFDQAFLVENAFRTDSFFYKYFDEDDISLKLDKVYSKYYFKKFYDYLKILNYQWKDISQEDYLIMQRNNDLEQLEIIIPLNKCIFELGNGLFDRIES